MNRSRVNDDLRAALIQALRRKGYRLTQARDAILGALAGSGGHVTADELVALVHEDVPTVGRMTVYRTLELLQVLGLVQPTYLGSGAASYILLVNGHHHHLKCSHCDRIIEFDECVLQEISKDLGLRYNFHIESHMLEFHGRCADCQQS